MPELAQAEEFWKTLYPFLFPEDSFRLAQTEVDRVLALIDFKGKTVLDLACGPGRHSILLAKKGFQVTGVDSSAHLLEKAKERASKEDVDVEFIQADMRDFKRPGAYDLALSMFTSFGYFDDLEDDMKVLQNIYDSLTPGGTLLMDLYSKEVLAKNFEPMGAAGPLGQFGSSDGTILIESHEIYDDWCRLRNQWLLVQDGKAQTFEFAHWLYSGRELKDRLEQVGFKTVKLFGDFRGKEYGIHAQRLVAVATK